MVNLDYASHTPVSEAVLAEFCRVEQKCAANPLAAHESGQIARQEMERATEGIAALLGVKASEIIYTSGASEANNLAIKGIAKAYAHVGKHILSTCLEHPSTSGALAFLGEAGYEIELLKILPNGKIDPIHLESSIRYDTILLCISAVDSELGAIQDLDVLVRSFPARSNCRLHVDLAQAMGKIPIAISNFATMSFSPHKFHGLGGFGVLIKREGVVLEPLVHGGSAQNDAFGYGLYRGGTPSPAMAAACHLALREALHSQESNLKIVREIRDYTLKNLQPLISAKKIKVNSPPDGSPYILNLSTQNIKGKAVQAALNDQGIAISVKSACSTDNAPSRPVFAISGDKKNAQNSWRISFDFSTTKSEIDKFINHINNLTC
ncbi:MAG: aminotransferase class V-fold PLP-dependent enzyme [Defluviitaleaceae bacterium]|nr:aminotransferase class V-fold PLP-dependent enzyme [Defluviitaleaceae bacterium]